MKTLVRNSALAAVAAGALLAATPAPALADSGPVPWSLSWQNGSAAGNYTSRQDPYGIMRYWTVTGSVTGAGADECYFVRVDDGVDEDSASACGTSSATIDMEFVDAVWNPYPTIQLCRTDTLECGPAKTLSFYW